MENYEVLSRIGTGSFGAVTKVRRKSDSKTLVWKEITYGRMSDKEKQQLVAEVNILRELRHPHIVRYYDRIIDKATSKIFIVMEYCEGGDLGQIIKKSRRTQDFIAEAVLWKIFMQVILALNECHSRREGKILHRDIKAGNVFLDSSMNVKLGDFGLSRIMSEHSEYAQTHVGTPYYMSPEQIRDSKYNEKSDIWSLGCLLYEMTALHPPFEATTHKNLAMKICSGRFDRLPAQYTDELQRVVAWMLCVDLNQRPTVDDLLNLPQVSLRIREKRLKDNQALFKKKAEEVAAKEEEINLLERQVAAKEQELERRAARDQGYRGVAREQELPKPINHEFALERLAAPKTNEPETKPSPLEQKAPPRDQPVETRRPKDPEANRRGAAKAHDLPLKPKESLVTEVEAKLKRAEEVLTDVRRPPRSSTEASFEAMRRALPTRDSPRPTPAISRESSLERLRRETSADRIRREASAERIRRETSAERIRRIAVPRLPVQIPTEQDTPRVRTKRSNFSAECSPRPGFREKRTVSPYPQGRRETSVERKAPRRTTSKENVRPQTAYSRKEDFATMQEITRYIQAHQRPRTTVARPVRRY